MLGRQALNHIYKDLVSIVITQSTDKGYERVSEWGIGGVIGGGGGCVCCVLVGVMLCGFMCILKRVCV